MIVPSMTVQEVYMELFTDVQTLHNRDQHYRKEFAKMALKASRYPISKSYEARTKRNNLFVLTYSAMKRSHWKKPFVKIYGIYDRPEGSYAAVLSFDINLVSIYPPHFFKRYRERIVKDHSISNKDIIRRYFNNDWGMVEVYEDPYLNTVYCCFENNDEDEAIDFVGMSGEGYCFGEKQKNLYCQNDHIRGYGI